jgi:hypothetical protein
MTATLVQDLEAQAQDFWAPVIGMQLREEILLPGLVSKEYEGEIKQYGDTVKVSIIQNLSGSISTVGTDHETYKPEKLNMSQVEIKANKVIEASIEIDSLVSLQTQLGTPQGASVIRDALMFAINKRLNEFCYSLVAPSTSAPDHSVAAVATMNKAAILANRLLASNAKWGMDKEWIGLLGPAYWNNVLDEQTFTSSDYVGSDLLIPGNKNKAVKRLGFSLFEDNSDASSVIGGTSGRNALFFHPDWLVFVMQQGMTIKLSDLHAVKKRGYLLSAEILVGGGLNNEGSLKHIVNYQA